MPLTQILPKVEPFFYQEITWPDYETFTVGDPFTAITQQTDVLRGRTGSAYEWWSAPFSSGTGADSLQLYRDRLCARFVGGTGLRGRIFASAWPISFPMEFSEGVSVLEEMRVIWDTLFLAKSTGVDSSNNTGVAYVVRSGTTTPTWPANHYGLFGRDNGWRWRAYNNGSVLLESVDLVWPVALDQFARVDILHFPANPAGAASVQVLVNNVPLISRSFAAGTLLPTFGTSGLANANYLQRRVNAGAGITVWAANMRYRAGKFNFDGVAVQ